jgi:NitT/TauT family transport system substrate-binding protein
MRMRVTGIITALAVVLFAMHGAFAQTALPVVRVVGPPNDGFKAVFYGVKAGIFKKYGLDVQTSIVASGAAAAAALTGSGADVAYTNILTLIQAHTHNVPMVFVAAGNLQLPGTSQTKTIVAADSTIKSGKDMIGKTLGSASLRDINAAATLAWIDKTGGDSKQLKVVEVPASAGAAFLEEHRADAITLNEPAVSQAVATGKAKVLAQPYDAVGAGMTAGFAAMVPYVTANRDVMERFAKAMHEASLYTNAHPAETVDIVAQYSGVPADVVAKSVRFSDAEFLEPRYLQPMIDLCAHYNLIDRGFPAREVISDVTVKPPR